MIELPDYVSKFLNAFQDQNYEIYLVGGTVRGLLMSHAVNDWDFTTKAKPEEIQKMFPHSFYNNTFGTVGIPIEVDGDRLVFEVTTFRKEGKYSNARHPDEIQWARTVEEDLARRDFTINAMAYDSIQNNLVDPFHGQQDIEQKIIRAVGAPEKRFAEDALRMLRAVRQAAQLGFVIEDKTQEAIRLHAKQIHKISWERVRDEFFKLLMAKHSADGIMMLKSVGLLKQILPELDMAFEVDQVSPERHHIYDVGTHLVESLRHSRSGDVITRFATLVHDIGKVKTYQKDPETQIITFHNHEVVGGLQAEEIANRFKLSNKQKKKLVMLVRQHQFSVSEEQTDTAIKRFIRKVGKENIQDMLELRRADRIGSGAKETSWRTELFKKRIAEVQIEPFTVHDLKITGHDVMKELNMKPGPRIGDILDALFEKVEKGEIKNEKKELMAELKHVKSLQK